MTTILSVDDSVSMRALVKETLVGAGYDVVQAEDGEQALEMARSRRVNLCIVDINMPKMDGLTLVKELRTLGTYKGTPILMLTTEMSPERKKEAKASGATGWVTKPFDPRKLLDTVTRVLG